MVNNTLINVVPGSRVRLRGFTDAETLAARLRQYGLFIGDEVHLLRIAPLKGPLLLEVGGRTIALGRGIASCILVEPI